MLKFLLGAVFFGLFLLFSGCSQTSCSEEEELITQPVTNNPLIVPNYGSGIPGLPSGNDGRHF
ncbi:MAG: hypothetical protein WC371_05825 [Parachlamydiales bacterium]|jgi:hypothetical protein